jgi:hypothetical protein
MTDTQATNLTFGVPWERLCKARQRVEEFYAPKPRASQVWPVIFLCGLKFGGTYGASHGQQVIHATDDGLNQHVAEALPILMMLADIPGPRPPKAERAIKKALS